MKINGIGIDHISVSQNMGYFQVVHGKYFLNFKKIIVFLKLQGLFLMHNIKI